MDIKAMPKEFFIGIFVVVYFLYSFVAFRNDFLEDWRVVRIGDKREEVIELLGSPHTEQKNMDHGRLTDPVTLPGEGEFVAVYLIWSIGVNADYILGFNDFQTVIMKATHEPNRAF